MDRRTGTPTPFLDLLDDETRVAILQRGGRRSYRRRDIVFRQGDASNVVFVVRSGHVAVTTLTPEGRESILALRGPGDLVGEQALLDDQPRSATLRAASTTELLAFTGPDFQRFVNDYPQSSFAMLRSMSRRLRESDRARTSAATEPVVTRLARLFLDLSGGSPTPSGIALPLSQEEIGSWIGASREATAKALRTFRDEGSVTTARNRIDIVDPVALRVHAGASPRGA